MQRLPSLSLVIAGQTRCSGLCNFCHCSFHYDRFGVPKDKDLKESLVGLDNICRDEAVFDFPALEERIISTDKWKKSGNKFHFTIWGTDPLTSFTNFQEVVDFCRDLCKRHNKQVHISTSTNGLPLIRDDIVEYLLKSNDITFQLSHDGYGQFFRTQDTDPFKFDGTQQLLYANKITSISCILNQYNALVIPNYELIVSNLPRSSNCGVRLWTMHVGHYDGQQANARGLLNGQEYDELKGKKFGDFMIRNDYKMAEETGIVQLARQCDDHFADWNHILSTFDDPKWSRLRSALVPRLRAGTMHLSTTSKYGRPDCANFHHGLQDYSDSIDTLGNFTQCHLLQGGEPVPNPEFKMAKICSTCKYRHQQECMMCGAMPALPEDYICQWPYRWGQLIDEWAYREPVKKWIDGRAGRVNQKQQRKNSNKGGDCRCQHPMERPQVKLPTMEQLQQLRSSLMKQLSSK